MKNRSLLLLVAGIALVSLAIVLTSCGGALPTLPPAPPTQPPTQPPTVPPTAPPTQPPTETSSTPGAAAYAVDLIGAWVDAGSPETDAFNYKGEDGNTYQATFTADILPLFTTNGAWFEGSQACAGCHFAASESSAHQMNLSSYAGIRTGPDSIESPPGESILGESAPNKGDFNWDSSKLRERLRNNRMPPGWEFDVTEENRNGPCVEIEKDGVDVELGEYDCDLHAVELIGAWVDADAPNGDFTYNGATLNFERDILPFFTKNSMWFKGSQACASCHFAASESSAHQMDLSSYQGIRTGPDSIESPPGESILGESAPNKGDFNWDNSKLRARLRNNRMPPGWVFDITEGNRNGPLVLAGKKK